MLKHISTLGLLGVAALGFVAMPASADTAVVQQGTQDIYIQGDGNAAVQSSQQINRIYRDRAGRPTPSTGVVQDIYQGGTVVGEGNGVYQESSQVNVVQERVRPNQANRGRGHGPGTTINQD
jgi:hypothetical protein